MLKFLSFLLDIIPFIGGFKMMLEAIGGKEMTGTILIKNARLLHLVFAIISIILDVFTFGLAGTGGRVIFKIFSEGFIKRGARKAALRVASSSGKQAVSRKIATGLYKTVAGMEGKFVGRMILRSGERRIRRGAEHTLGNVHGYRFDQKKREELRNKYGVDIKNKDDVKELAEDTTGKSNLHNIKKTGFLINQLEKQRNKFVKDKYGYNVSKHRQENE